MIAEKRLPLPEFVAGLAMMSAMVALSIDAMLPALPQIGLELVPLDLNQAQLMITSFVLGLGIGTLFAGPLSDAFGRKPVMFAGAALYIVAAFLVYVSPSLTSVLASRMLMGLGAAAPRVVSLAVIRDLYSGREMARIVSFVMLVFALVPALAPLMGSAVIAVAGWREIFLVFMVFALCVIGWFALRQAETLALTTRRPFQLSAIIPSISEMFRNPAARLAILVQSLAMGMLFTVLSSTQQTFDVTFAQGANFPYWFGGIAVMASSASVLNAKLVMRLGMRALVTAMLSAQVLLSAGLITVILLDLPTPLTFAAFVLWTTGVFFQAGLTIGNLNALGLEPMGHMAGMAASIMTSLATVAAVVIAVPVGLAFDGTALPQAVGVLACALVARWMMRTRVI